MARRNNKSFPQADFFPRMRNLTAEDLRAIAGYILTQLAIAGEQ
ncbi:MAG: hypothetical protein ACR2FS_09385 [Phormidesmis sp.]